MFFWSLLLFMLIGVNFSHESLLMVELKKISLMLVIFSSKLASIFHPYDSIFWLFLQLLLMS